MMCISYVWKGQKRSILEIMKKAKLILPNSASEYSRIKELYGCKTSFLVVPNAVDSDLFRFDNQLEKDPNLVLCIARIEGIKNQANLIRAMNNTKFRLILIGTLLPDNSLIIRCAGIWRPQIFILSTAYPGTIGRLLSAS